MATINDLVPSVQDLIGRNDSRIPRWIRSSILELSESNAFEELRVLGPQAQLTPPSPSPGTQASYPLSQFLQPTHVNATQVVAFSLFVDYPQNTVIRQLEYRVPQVIDSMGTLQSLPIYWTRLGQVITFAPVPQLAYTVFMRYQQVHPFNDGNLGTSLVLMPSSWYEIIEYSAALRAATILRAKDYMTNFHDILFGDPLFQSSGGKKGRPGLIAARTLQNERDSSNNTRRLGVQVAAYSR